MFAQLSSFPKVQESPLPSTWISSSFLSMLSRLFFDSYIKRHEFQIWGIPHANLHRLQSLNGWYFQVRVAPAKEFAIDMHGNYSGARVSALSLCACSSAQ
mmetsp:Transcript_43454/g.70417  ORF Transcript_43454/g.70417 Transcript_43454/m.70417 type:complete len:100 (+) Transcript_43454:678-977(+)